MWWALAGFVIYVIVGLYTKNLYPFSSYSMYASVPTLTYAGVPTFRAEGEVARLRDYVDFEGIDPERMFGEHMPCTLYWMIYEAQRWVREHPAGQKRPKVPVTWGFQVVTVHPDGSITETFVPVQHGLASRRTS